MVLVLYSCASLSHAQLFLFEQIVATYKPYITPYGWYIYIIREETPIFDPQRLPF